MRWALLTAMVVAVLASPASALIWTYWVVCDSDPHPRKAIEVVADSSVKDPRFRTRHRWEGPHGVDSTRACAEAERHKRNHPKHIAYVLEGEYGPVGVFDCAKRCYNGLCQEP
jgi:hypothetical protein